ncbi:MAG: DUF1343 domain-containing protein [Planctomycetaceae bacterium]|nr:DUF1343 domain-containing protein [Planctomycetaceae bacterium]
MKKFAVFLLFLVEILLCSASHSATRLPEVAAKDAGLRPEILAFIDGEVEKAIANKQMPGCVVAIGRQGKLAFLKAYGNKQVEPSVVPMDVETVFDLASVTKPVATATSIMVLVDQGKIDIDEKVARYLPDFAENGKENVTVRQLLVHTAGLIPDNHLDEYNDGAEKAIERFVKIDPTSPPGQKFVYSDIGFQILGELVRRIGGKDVNQFSHEFIFGPLGMDETMYLPNDALRKRAATTQQREGRWMQGEVHDPRAYKMDGVAGHAGLFSTARDLAVYADMMLQFGQSDLANKRILREATVRKMTAGEPVPESDPTGMRGLGWDKRSSFSSNRGWNMSPQAFGHGGFTGTGLWIDPGHDLFVIFLSNRVHPDGTGSVNPLIGKIGTIAVDSIDRSKEPPKNKTAKVLEMKNKGKLDKVLTGIDVLRRDNFAILKGKKVGLISNHTGLAADGTSTPMLLKNAEGVEFVCLFSPEHGFAGTADVSGLKDEIDPATGLTVYSLYGETRRPTPKMLKGIDTLVFDITDIGARFYTYTSTMGMAMQAAAENGIAFVVLDRPNPIGGVQVEGGQPDPGSESFIAFHPIAIRHGMTLGELALLFNDEQSLNLDLTVVPAEGWERKAYFEETQIPWINPSPNMKTVNGAVNYPGLCLIEFTNLSVGRGTDIPFEIVGASWIDGEKLAAALNAKQLAGVRFEPTQFTPPVRQYANELCNGVKICVENRETFDSVLFGLTLVEILIKDYGDQWECENLNRLLLHCEVLEMLETGKSAENTAVFWNTQLQDFLKRRERYLIYSK